MTTERPGPPRLLTGAFLAAALVVGGSLGALEVNGVASPLDRIENLTLDWRFLLAGARPAPAGGGGAGGGGPKNHRTHHGAGGRRGMRTWTRNSPARSRRGRLSSQGSECSTQSIVLETPNPANWRWRRSRPPF